MTKPVKIGLIGCGNISEAYLKKAKTFDGLDIIACADLILERAQERARTFDVPKAYTVKELLADPEIEIVLNLSIPNTHMEIGLAALKAGKHHYAEKPLGIHREQGRRLIEMAAETGLRLGNAPDTFLGGGLQTCRKLIDDGAIGEPVAATAFMGCHGHESWHPSPEFYYKAGGGPMLDMGPYYLTALVSLIGPVCNVSGAARITFPTRTITSKPQNGTVVDVEVPTHVTGTLEFANGAIGTVMTSFDLWHHSLPVMEIYGTEGSLSVPDPNDFSGPVRIRSADDKEWREVPLTHPYTDNCRSIGLADMACAIRSGRKHRASGELAFHVLDIMDAFNDAEREGKRIALSTTCERPAPLPLGLVEGTLDV